MEKWRFPFSLSRNADGATFTGIVQFRSCHPGARSIIPLDRLSDVNIFSSLMTNPQLGYFVFLYYALREARKPKT